MVVLGFIAIIIPDTWVMIRWIYPQTAIIKTDLFFSSSYKNPQTILWYVYELGQLLDKIIWTFIIIKILKFVALNYLSEKERLIIVKLVKAMIVFMLYYFSQIVEYFWNRNNSLEVNLVLYAVIMVLLILNILHKESGKIIKMKK